MITSRHMAAMAAVGALALGAAACGSDDEGGGGGGGGDLSGTITIDGSSTVFPFAQAAAEQFQTENPNVKITVGESGTGGGFEKFCAGETEVSDASRPIKDEEIAICEKNGVKYAEIQIANDGIAVISNPELKIDCLTTDQLKQLWSTSKVTDYDQLGGGTPAGKVSLYGPGTDSGTFDFFTDVINGEEGLSRKDFQASEDDNVLVEGISGDKTGSGYFGFSYYEQNKDKLNLIGVKDGSAACVKPSKETIQDGSYKPLSRPLFMYVSDKAIAKPEVKAFFDAVLAENETITENALIVPLTPEQLTTEQADLKKIEADAGGADTAAETS